MVESTMFLSLSTIIFKHFITTKNNNCSGVFLWALNMEEDDFCVWDESKANCNFDGFLKQLWQVKAFTNALTTRISLSRRGVVGCFSECGLCQTSEETYQHLFLEFFVAQVWSLCLRWMGILNAQHKDLKSHFVNFHLVHFRTKQILVWKGLWLGIARGVWEQRNIVIFKQGKPNAQEIFHQAQPRSRLWMTNMVCAFNFSFLDWLLNLELCRKSYR